MDSHKNLEGNQPVLCCAAASQPTQARRQSPTQALCSLPAGFFWSSVDTPTSDSKQEFGDLPTVLGGDTSTRIAIGYLLGPSLNDMLLVNSRGEVSHEC